MIAFGKAMRTYAPDADLSEDSLIPGYINAAMVATVLAACGNELTRANILDKATHLSGATPPMLLPGIRLSNTPSDYTAFHQLQLTQFNGTRWTALGDLVELGDLPAARR